MYFGKTWFYVALIIIFFAFIYMYRKHKGIVIE